MEKRRLELHEILCNILDTRNVYFQPPESVKIVYPAIVYSVSDIKSTFANNSLYKLNVAYTITVIDEDPDSKTPYEILRLPTCKFNTRFTSENLNHTSLTLYF